MDLPHSTPLPSRKPVSALILQRTSRCVYELKTNRYSSFKQNKVILFKNDYMFRFQRATITKTKIKFNAAQITLV
jgi:hypothetical protein